MDPLSAMLNETPRQVGRDEILETWKTIMAVSFYDAFFLFLALRDVMSFIKCF